jgi:heat shock protein HtpX
MSRNREYLADATAVRLTRNSTGLADALERLRDDEPDDPTGSRTVASLYLANPFSRTVETSHLFATHPPLNERIRRIREMR